jgi:hypothetical protein
MVFCFDTTAFSTASGEWSSRIVLGAASALLCIAIATTTREVDDGTPLFANITAEGLGQSLLYCIVRGFITFSRYGSDVQHKSEGSLKSR